MFQANFHQLVKNTRENLKLWFLNPTLPTEPIHEQLTYLSAALSRPCHVLLPPVFESDFLHMLLKAWHTHNSSAEFADVILIFMRKLSDAVLEANGDFELYAVTVGFWMDPEVCLFYSKMYEVASPHLVLPLLDKENQVITSDLCETLVRFPELFHKWYKNTDIIPLLEFVVMHATVFPKEAAKMLNLAREFHEKLVLHQFHALDRFLTWNDEDSLVLFTANWKVLFYEELLFGQNEHPHFLGSFHRFLNSVRPWHRAMDMCVYFAEYFGPKFKASVVIARVVEARMLGMCSAPFDSHTEFEVVSLLGYIGEFLDCDNENVTKPLFYVQNRGRIRYDGLDKFERCAQDVVNTDETTVSDHQRYCEGFCSMKRKYKRGRIELGSELSLLHFLMECLRKFFLNSTKVNQSLSFCIGKLLTFDYQYSCLVPIGVLNVFVEILESVDLDAFRMSLLVTSSPNEEELARQFDWDGAKQNLVMFERMMSCIYALVRAKQGELGNLR